MDFRAGSIPSGDEVGSSDNPTEAIAQHRLASEVLAALEAGNLRKAQRHLTRIFKDQQTGWYMRQFYRDGEGLAELQRRLRT